VQTLANHIEHELQHGLWQHCAIYEDELQRVWPLETPYRELRIADFAVRYGFRLRFYQKGVCAIFEKQPRSDQRAGYRSVHARRWTTDCLCGTTKGDTRIRIELDL